MSKYKMSDVFDLPTTPAKFWLAPVQRDNDDRRQQQVKFLVHAINTHDAIQTRITELELLLKFTKDALFRDQFVVDTVWFDENTTLCDQIELTLEQNA